jgi:hypothetical protein
VHSLDEQVASLVSGNEVRRLWRVRVIDVDVQQVAVVRSDLDSSLIAVQELCVGDVCVDELAQRVAGTRTGERCSRAVVKGDSGGLRARRTL